MLCQVGPRFSRVTSDLRCLHFGVSNWRHLTGASFSESECSSRSESQVPFEVSQIGQPHAKAPKITSHFWESQIKIYIRMQETDLVVWNENLIAALIRPKSMASFLWWSVLQKELLAPDGILKWGKEDRNRLWPFSYINISSGTWPHWITN